MKKIFTLLISVYSVNAAVSQCATIVIPKEGTSGNGGNFCLEGSNFPNICLSNTSGNFTISQGLNDTFSSLYQRLILKNDTVANQTQLELIGPNPQGSRNEILFNFSSAGQAKISSLRSSGYGTYFDFFTNPNTASNGTSLERRMRISDNGYVGIGTGIEPPRQLLDVNGIATFCNITDASSKIVINGPNTANYTAEAKIMNPDVSRDISFEFYGDPATAKIRGFRGGNYDTFLQFLTNESTDSNGIPKVRMQINGDGKVLIGNVANPMTINTANSYKLYVETGILTEKVKVAVKNATNWSDYVFYPDYHLKPLSEVEQFIKQNNHLPEIPSSDELVSNGLDLGEMQAKQMKKIEELTLYLIEMKKEIEVLKAQNAALQKNTPISK